MITKQIKAKIEQMREADTEFLTAENVAQFARCTEFEAALVLDALGFRVPEVKGLRLDIYLPAGGSCSNGGISSQLDTVTLVATCDLDGVVAPLPLDAQLFAASAEAPAVMLVGKSYSFGEHVHVEPVAPGEGVGPMMGGCYVGAPDARFGALLGKVAAGPVPLHDRFETAAQYASHD